TGKAVPRSTRSSHTIVYLVLRNPGGIAVHSSLSAQPFAQGGCAEFALSPRCERRQSPRIKIIQRPPQLAKIDNLQPPAVQQIRSGLERPVISAVVKPRDVNRIFRLAKNFQLSGSFIVSVTKRETGATASD